MTMNGTQPSAPPFQNYRPRWLQYPLATETVPPLFDYELYRANRGPSFNRGTPSARSNAGAIDPGCGMGLSSIVNACYENNPDNRIAMQQSHHSSASPWLGRPIVVRAAVGPPAYMAGGGFENTYQKQQKAKRKDETVYCSCSNRRLARELELSVITTGGRDASASTRIRGSETRPMDLSGDCNSIHCDFHHGYAREQLPLQPQKACLLPSLRRFAFQPFGENPLLGPSAKTLIRMGALESELVTKAHEAWRLLSTIWLHAGVLHIMGTVLGMLVLGIPLERQLGFVKVGIVYVLSGFMGSLLSALMVNGRVSVGPSGAFMGLLGATLSSILTNWSSYRNRSRTLMGMIFFIALNTVYGLMPFVDNFMHVGGAVTGFLLGNLFFIRHHIPYCWKSSAASDQDTTGVPGKRSKVILIDIVCLLSLGTLVGAIIMAMVALFSGKNLNEGCSWCRYLTCAPSHYWKCTSSRNLGCNPSSYKGGMRVTCANGRSIDYSTVQYAGQLTPEIEGLCVKACI